MLTGDSTSGNLVITPMMKLRADGVPQPTAIAYLSLVVDLSCHRRELLIYSTELLC